MSFGLPAVQRPNGGSSVVRAASDAVPSVSGGTTLEDLFAGGAPQEARVIANPPSAGVSGAFMAGNNRTGGVALRSDRPDAAPWQMVTPRFQGAEGNCFNTAKAMVEQCARRRLGDSTNTLLANNGRDGDGMQYIKSSLEQGLPVVVGVTYDGQRANPNPNTPGHPAHFLVLQRDARTGQVMAFDPATRGESAVVPAQFNGGNIVIPGYHNYTVACVVQYRG